MLYVFQVQLKKIILPKLLKLNILPNFILNKKSLVEKITLRKFVLIN